MADTTSPGPHEVPTGRPPTLAGRVAAMFFLAFAVAYGLMGATIEYAFSSDPLGPRAVPVLLAVLLGLLSVWYLLAPGDAEPWPQGPAARDIVAVLVATAVAVRLIPVLGFPLPISLLCMLVAAMFGSRWPLAILGGAGQGFGWWLLFWLLGVSLPFWPRLEEAGRLLSNPFGT